MSFIKFKACVFAKGNERVGRFKLGYTRNYMLVNENCSETFANKILIN